MGQFSVVHWIILLFIVVFVVAVVAGIVLLVVGLSNRGSASNREAALQAENERLQEELARLKKGSG
jgi:hypothetical protein